MPTPIPPAPPVMKTILLLKVLMACSVVVLFRGQACLSGLQIGGEYNP
jgi:hypothetical protein